MTDAQMMTYKNHDGSVTKYDMISLFSLRPPELLGVFRNPIDYYRYCYIDTKTMKEITVESMLVADLYSCLWVDCLGRRVKIRELAMDDVLELVVLTTYRVGRHLIEMSIECYTRWLLYTNLPKMIVVIMMLYGSTRQ